MTTAVWAVVVARTGPTAKSRLAAVLGPSERAALALAMLADVLAACAAAPLAGTVVITDTRAGRDLAATRGARALADPGDGMNAAATAGLRAAAAAGAEAALILPGDVPLVRPDDLRAVVAAGAAGPAVVVATDRAGTGTNGLLLRPPRVVAPTFGPGSAERHLAAGRRAGARPVRMLRPHLAADVDSPADLEALRLSAAGVTARALARIRVPTGG